MRVVRCPVCGSSNAETLCRVNDRIEFKCRMCDRWFLLKDDKKDKVLKDKTNPQK
jgi:transposase-like protein